MARNTKRPIWKTALMILGVAFVGFLAIPQVRQAIAGFPVVGDFFAQLEAKIKG